MKPTPIQPCLRIARWKAVKCLSLFVVVVLGAFPSEGQGIWQWSQSECPRPVAVGHACANARSDPLKRATYDFVPVALGGFHVVYSHKRAGPISGSNNVGIFVFEIDPTPSGRQHRILIFGSGYGDVLSASLGSRCDAGLVQLVITNELGFSIADTDVVFVAPHGHADHINPEFLQDLVRRGFAVTDIFFHEDDEHLVPGCGGGFCGDSTAEYLATGLPTVAMMNWGGNPAQGIGNLTGLLRKKTAREIESELTWSSPLGLLRARVEPGHTCGTLDLILDNAGFRIAVRGANCNFGKPIGFPLLYELKAHGNALVPPFLCR